MCAACMCLSVCVRVTSVQIAIDREGGMVVAVVEGGGVGGEEEGEVVGVFHLGFH